MKPIERVMRIMTQVNIGAALGMVAWILWSGHQVATGAWQVPHAQPPAHTPAPSTRGGSVDLDCCFAPAPRRAQTAAERSTATRRMAALDRSAP